MFRMSIWLEIAVSEGAHRLGEHQSRESIPDGTVDVHFLDAVHN
jgi:hypothetical protein